MFSLVGSVPTDQVNEPYQSTFRLMSSTTLNIQVLALECDYANLTFFDFMIYKMMMPMAVITVLFMLYELSIVCQGYVKILTEKSRADLSSAAIRTCVMVMALLYLPITSSVLSYVGCSVLEDSTWVLDLSPDIECFENDHMAYLPLFAAGVVLYVIGIPALLYYIVAVKRSRMFERHGILPEWYQKRYGFLSLKYRDEVYWYVIRCDQKIGAIFRHK